MNNSRGSAKGRGFRLPALLATILLCGAGIATAEAAGPVTREISSAGTATLRAGAEGVDGLQNPEFDPGLAALNSNDAPSTNAATALGASGNASAPSSRRGRFTNRSFARASGAGESVDSAEHAPPAPGLVTSFDGLNHRQTRLANGGNQFSNEPPDQGLCVGNGYVMETVNSVLRVFDTHGNPLTGAVDLNTFYGYAAALNRTTGAFGPNVFDPSCYFDPDTQRWFHVAGTLDRVGTTSDLSGKNHIDIAVSTTANPLGSWNIYRLAAQDDGTDGTPDHNCSGGMDKNGNPTGHGPCFADYPHIGADANGIYITTNEFSFFGPEFKSAQIYAISKRALAAGAANITVVQIDTIDHLLSGNPGFTVWPATSPFGEANRANRGTEYFLSSVAVFNDNGRDHRLRVWALTNTSSLDSSNPNLFVSHNAVGVAQYSVPPLSNQKAGDFPLGQCINDTTMDTPFGPGCWQFLFTAEPAHDEVLSPLDSNDSRMQQVVYSDGKLYGALDTSVKVRGQDQAGIAYYVLRPFAFGNAVFAFVQTQGKIGLANNNVTYPAIAALPNGKAVMAFTLVGADHHPSAAYVKVDEWFGAGPVQVAAEGVGTQDGFTGYKAEDGDPPRPRWGDYGAAIADDKEGSIWIASEYIGQTCTLAQYATSPFGSCGQTRTTLANWGTRISQIKP